MARVSQQKIMLFHRFSLAHRRSSCLHKTLVYCACSVLALCCCS